MIEIIEKDDYANLKSFGFRAKSNYSNNKELQGTLEERIRQDIEINSLQYLLDDLKNVPCEINVRISYSYGSLASHGEIIVYNRAAKLRALIIVEIVLEKLIKFGANYVFSGFEMYHTQSIVITKSSSV